MDVAHPQKPAMHKNKKKPKRVYLHQELSIYCPLKKNRPPWSRDFSFLFQAYMYKIHTYACCRVSKEESKEESKGEGKEERKERARKRARKLTRWSME